MRAVLVMALVLGMSAQVGFAQQGQTVAGAWLPATELTAQPRAAEQPVRHRVSVQFQATPLRRALADVARRAGLVLFVAPQVKPAKAGVTLTLNAVPAVEALVAVLEGTGLEAFVAPDGKAVRVDEAIPLAPAAAGTIVGKVTDAKTQTAIAGATVVVQGTSRSTTTGTDGRYRIAAVAPGTYTVRARYIGYVPGTASVTVSADQETTADVALEKSAQRLDEVVTTGTVVPTEVKALPTPISVVTADDIQRQNLQRVDQVFRGEVPGAIAWDQGPGNDSYSRIAVRGASTTPTGGVPGIKTFIDGVEVADPIRITTIDPSSIERIEITRGPQASTLYGAGALNGVMQIFTKKGRLGLSRPEVTGKVSAGGIGGYGSGNTAFETDNALSVLGGGNTGSYNLAGSYRHTGEWVPSYHSTDWGASASGQTTQGPLALSGSMQYADKEFEPPFDARLQAYTAYSKPFYNSDRPRRQTYGVTASLQATRSWQHSLTLGYDRSYEVIEQTQARFTTPADSFLSVYGQDQTKVSLLYHTDLSVRVANTIGAVVTAGINYDNFDYVAPSAFGLTRTTGFLGGSTFISRTPWTNTGYFAQLQANVAERFFLTGGLRAERNANFGVNFGTAWSPRVGASYVLGFGQATVKLRASYGESIRAPNPGAREGSVTPYSILLANPNLAPERQRGADGGIDISVGRASIGVTYYSQRALDLIEYVTIPTPVGALPTHQWRNISRVKNDGWEFEGRLPVGPLQLAGTYSITNSTVQELPPGYAGDLQVGDQMLEIPHTTAGATVTYSPGSRTTLTASMTYIGHWTSYDQLALFGVYFGNQPYLGSLRAYWINYPAVTKFAVGVSQTLAKDVTAFVRAENVGNTLRSEESNYNLPTPRSIMAGANFRY